MRSPLPASKHVLRVGFAFPLLPFAGICLSGPSGRSPAPCQRQQAALPYIRMNAFRKLVGFLQNRMWSCEFSGRFVSVNAGVM